MKKHKIYQLIILVTILFASCEPHKQYHEINNPSILTYQGCEYIQYFNHIAHKGNCKNPIHIYNDTTKNSLNNIPGDQIDYTPRFSKYPEVENINYSMVLWCSTNAVLTPSRKVKRKSNYLTPVASIIRFRNSNSTTLFLIGTERRKLNRPTNCLNTHKLNTFVLHCVRFSKLIANWGKSGTHSQVVLNPANCFHTGKCECLLTCFVQFYDFGLHTGKSLSTPFKRILGYGVKSWNNTILACFWVNSNKKIVFSELF